MQTTHQLAGVLDRSRQIRWFAQHLMIQFMTACFALSALASSAAGNDAVLLEFSSAQCGPCLAMKPVVSELIARGVPVRQVDVNKEAHLTRRFGIRSTPTYVVLREGEEVTRLLGVQSVSELSAALNQTAAGPLIPTRSTSTEPAWSEPQTRLAPLTSGQNAVDRSPRRAIRKERADSDSNPANDWQAMNNAAAPSAQLVSSRDAAMEPMPSMSLADAIEKAKAATVRLRVFDGRGYGAGTGTIIDTNGDEALVLTCGHLFRDGEGKDRIEVDLFVAGEVRTVAGQVVDYDAGDRDIGLVAIRPGFAVEPVKVIQEGETVKVGQTAFSFGCDRGDDPSRRDTRITGVDKYNQNLGASNLEIDGAPIDGRSGGGLFDDRGVLIGVCNAADYKSDLGIYTGPGSVHWQLERIQLGRLYQGSPAAPVSNQLAATQSSPAAPANQFVNEPALNAPSQFGANVAAAAASAPAMASAGTATEMIVILRDPDGQQREQVMTLSSPDADLVRQIRQAAMSR
ncbi:protein folding and stabilization [Rhodopirellula islandica]|uniref:Protein folding and stabilization n=1 Tax=Rhodopirellula islandica TaxID=595434 RepID=A0A0J1BK90_RHOIS|nr:trypsin-like peptidase domain-containing protein [Rhodopirellula islandica]KLU06951.1 protein folding and stabilization [Rhodopirellula islandica]